MVAEYNIEWSRHSLQNKEIVCANPIDHIGVNLRCPQYR